MQLWCSQLIAYPSSAWFYFFAVLGLSVLIGLILLADWTLFPSDKGPFPRSFMHLKSSVLSLSDNSRVTLVLQKDVAYIRKCIGCHTLVGDMYCLGKGRSAHWLLITTNGCKVLFQYGHIFSPVTRFLAFGAFASFDVRFMRQLQPINAFFSHYYVSFWL